MTDSTFRLAVSVPRKVEVGDRTYEREDFYAWVWSAFSREGIVGVHEGSMLCTEAAERGFETESWTLDAAEAPRERDWISNQKIENVELYFSSREGAESAARRLSQVPGLTVGRIEEQKAQDWDAEWKASFTGAKIPPCWQVLPPWISAKEAALAPHERIIRINPGAGFGTGTHETTQLCLQAIAESAQKNPLQGQRVLDFGSGSGILAIGAALFGAKVDAIEIDPLAVDNARENARLNEIEHLITYSDALASAPGPYPMVIANILRPVLIQFSKDLVSRMAPGAILILSGLIETDTPEVDHCYSALLGSRPEKKNLGEWRSLVWRKGVNDYGSN